MKCLFCQKEIQTDSNVWIDRETGGDVCGAYGSFINEPHWPATKPAYVVYSKPEKGFWSNIDGWVSLSGASICDEQTKAENSNTDGSPRMLKHDQPQWLTWAEAAVIENGLQYDEDMGSP